MTTTPSSNNDSSPSRRDFLTTAGAAAMTLASGPLIEAPFVHADDKSGTKLPVVGVEGHKYSCHHGWGQLPDHIKWQETHGVAVDAVGLVYITHRAPKDVDTIAVFAPSGKFIRSWGKEYSGGGHGIDIRKEGKEEFLYLTWTRPQSKVTKMTLTGEKVWEMQQPTASGKYTDASQFNPTNIAFAPNGGFYVADGYGANYIHQYDRDANYVRTFGGPGTEAGQFKTPHGIWLDDRPGREVALVVADRANARLQYFSLEGVPQPDKMVNGVMSYPAHFDTRGTDLLAPDLHARVTILDKHNKLITHLGYDADWTKQVLEGFKMRTQPERWVAGRFIHPHDACFDKAGNIYVVEWVMAGRVSFLKHIG